MPAKIVVETGASIGQEFAVEEEVFRIGSGVACKLRLAEGTAAEHAATVEFRNGGYRLYNRGGQPLEVGGQQTPAGRAADWRPGQALKMGEGVVLRLVVQGDPAPVRRGPAVLTAAQVASDGPEKAAPAKPASSSKTVQWAVIAVCAAALVAFLLKPAPQAATASAGEVDVRQVVSELQRAEAADPWQESPATLLQTAHLAERRGQLQQAAGAYRRVVHLIRGRHGENLAAASPAEQQAHAFALARVRVLYGGER